MTSPRAIFRGPVGLPSRVLTSQTRRSERCVVDGPAAVGSALLGLRWAFGVGADQPGEDDKPLALLVVTTGQRRPTLSEGSSRPPASRLPTPLVPAEEQPVGVVGGLRVAGQQRAGPGQPAERGGDAWTVADRLVQGGSPPPPTCGSAITPRPPGGPRRPATCSPPPGKPSTPPSGAMWRRTPTSIAAAGRKIGTPRTGRPPTDPGRRPPSPWPAGPSSTASPRTACTGRGRTMTGTDVRGTDVRGWTSGVSTCSGRATASGPWRRNSPAPRTSGMPGDESWSSSAGARALSRSGCKRPRLRMQRCTGAPRRRNGHLPVRRDHGGVRSRRGRDHTAPAAGPWRAHRVRTPPPGHCVRGCGRDTPPTTAGLARTTITYVPEAPASHLVLDLDVRPVLDRWPVERHGGGLG